MTDARLQGVIGYLLRIGVWTALATVATGGVLYLLHHGQEPAVYPAYQPQHQSMGAVLHQLWYSLRNGKPVGLMLLGTMLLFATPMLRLLFSLIGFLLERDWLYVIITLIVIGVICVSIGGGLG
jgi:uncharacterized membrane protein